MIKRLLRHKVTPYIVAVLTFTVICALYFRPQYDGMTLRQDDMVQVSGMKQDIRKHVETYGEHPGWAGNMFGGMPSFLIDFPFDGRYVGQAASLLFFLKAPAAYIFIAMTGFFLMLLCFRVNPWLAIIGGIAYGFSSYLLIIIGAGHITKMMALAYAPPLVGAVFLTYRRKSLWLGVALTGIFAALEIGANHIQITYYFFFVLLALAVNEGIRYFKEKRLAAFFGRSAALIGAAVLAIGANAILLYYINDYTKDSTRGPSELTQTTAEGSEGLAIEYATNWSYGKLETFNLFIPNLYGGSSAGGFSDNGPVAEAWGKLGYRQFAQYMPGYWGEQPITYGPVYIGAVMIFLFVLAMFLLCGYKKWWVFSVTALSVLLAWGHNLMWFTEIFFYGVPLYNKFRVVSTMLVVAEWAVPLLGVLVLQRLWTGGIPKEKFIKSLKFTTAITGGIALMFMLFGGIIFDFTSAGDLRTLTSVGLPSDMQPDVLSAMITERSSMLRRDALRSLTLVLLSAGTVWAFYKEKLKRAAFVLVMAALVLIDMVGVDTRYLGHDSFMPERQATAIEASEATLAILQDTEPGYRVFNQTVSPFNDAFTSYYHRSVGGYHAAKLNRYQDLIEHHLSRGNMKAYNMLNTKYFIGSGEDGRPVPQYNPGRLGGAWIVDEIRYVENADAEIDALNHFEPAFTAIVDRRFQEITGNKTEFVHDSLSYVELTDYKPNHLTYEFESAVEAPVVFSEIYYPKGWTAYIDGEEVPHFRTNYVLRGLVVPAGNHRIEFVYEVPGYGKLKAVTAVCSSVLLVGLLAAIVGAVICKRKETDKIYR